MPRPWNVMEKESSKWIIKFCVRPTRTWSSFPGARVSGDVTMGHGCSVWYNAVIRGDEAPIAVGENTNIQDNCTLHTSYGHPLQVGSGVTVGHNAILHSCTVEDQLPDRHGCHCAGRCGDRPGLYCRGGGSGNQGHRHPGWVRYWVPRPRSSGPRPSRRFEGIRLNALAYVRDKELYR